MQNAATSSTPSTAEAASLSVPPWASMLQSRDATIQTLQQQIDVLKHQLDGFKRQLFGQKSERLAPLPDLDPAAPGRDDAAAGHAGGGAATHDTRPYAAQRDSFSHGGFNYEVHHG